MSEIEEIKNYCEKFIPENAVEREFLCRCKFLLSELEKEKMIEPKLAFAPGGKFSGIVIGDRLIEDGEVVEYIKKGEWAKEYFDKWELAEFRVKKLREAVEKHRNTEISGNLKIAQMGLRNEELYKILEEMKEAK